MELLGSKAWQNECDGWEALGRTKEAQGVFAVERTPVMVRAWWQRNPGEMDNYLMVDPAYRGSLADELRQVSDRVERSGAPTYLRFFQDSQADAWQAEAEEAGYTLAGEMPLMLCHLHAGRRPVAELPQVTVKEVVDADAYQKAFDIVQEVYGGPRELTAFFNPRDGVRMYIGYWQGEPAASATLWPFGGVAGIYSVATRPAYRGKGLATAVLDGLLGQAAHEGYTLAALRTVDELIPFYERVGVQPAGRVLSYVRR